jgi:hypothetical protein
MKPYYLLHNIIKFKGFSSTEFELFEFTNRSFSKKFDRSTRN